MSWCPESEGARLISQERRRQFQQEGWTPEHDLAHQPGVLLHAAVAYAFAAGDDLIDVTPPHGVPSYWPWDPEWWKPTGDPVRDLEKAGALIAAEIDRTLHARAEALCHWCHGHGVVYSGTSDLSSSALLRCVMCDQPPGTQPLGPLQLWDRDPNTIIPNPPTTHQPPQQDTTRHENHGNPGKGPNTMQPPHNPWTTRALLLAAITAIVLVVLVLSSTNDAHAGGNHYTTTTRPRTTTTCKIPTTTRRPTTTTTRPATTTTTRPPVTTSTTTPPPTSSSVPPTSVSSTTAPPTSLPSTTRPPETSTTSTTAPPPTNSTPPGTSSPPPSTDSAKPPSGSPPPQKLDTLPVTGSNAILLAWVALGLILAGGLVVVRGRRIR